MSENIDNLMLEHLKALRNEATSMRSEMHNEFSDMRERFHSLEAAMIGVKRDGTTQQEDIYRQQVKIDQLMQRIEKIEKRLELS